VPAPDWLASERLTVAELLDDRAGKTPDVTALWLDDVGYTFSDLARRSRAAASALLGLGVRPGDSVALLLESCIELVDVWLGATAAGIVSVPINIANRGDFLVHQLRDSRTVLLLADATTVDAVRAVAGELTELRVVVVVGDVGAGWPSHLRVVSSDALVADAVTSGEDAGAPWPDNARAVWNAPACILYTSGTTGPSKGVVVTQHYLVTAARIVADAYALAPGDVTYGAVPLFHFSGMLGSVLAAVVAGSSAVVDRRFSVSATWDRVRQYGATGVIAVGAMILMLWNLPESPDDPKLRFLAGAPIPAELHRRIEARYDCRIVTMYGMTEAFPLAVWGVGDDAEPGSAGHTSPLFAVRIFDDADAEVAVGEPGEIVCRPRAPHVMFEGYHGNPAATVGQWRNGWFHTGDFGRVDAHGNLFFVDRKKDAMRRRGENISSYEVEQSVLRHPAVAEVAAHAVPSDVGEDDVKICVIVRQPVTPEELLQHCIDRMPAFAVPRYIELVDDLPRNAVGRVLKYVLRERGVTPGTWDREQSALASRLREKREGR
jgi:crotonobetaine/carnitine-CoA ligase